MGARVDGWLHVAFGVALAYAVVADVRLVATGEDGPATAAVLLTLVVAGAWVLRARKRRRDVPPRLEDAALAVAALGLTVLSTSNPGELLTLVATLTLALDLGVGIALGYAALIAIGYFFSTLALYPDDTVATTIGPTFGTFALMAMPAGLGQVLRTLERARATSARAAQGLDRANRRLREALPGERALVLARERARSARGLHESLAERLRRAEAELATAVVRREGRPEDAWASVEAADDINRAALAEMRLWVRALDPLPARTLASPGSSEAIADTFRGTGLDVRVHHHGQAVSIDDEVALFTTRFVQESFTNVLKHSDAGRIDLEVHQEASGVRLVVVDDSRVGVAAVEAPTEVPPTDADGGAPGGTGLATLRRQADQLGGRVEVTPGAADQGFRVEAWLPHDPRPVAPLDEAPDDASAPHAGRGSELGMAAVAALGTALGLLVCWIVLRDFGVAEGVVGGALVIAGGLTWLRRRATVPGSPARVRADWVFAACAGILFLLPHTSEAAILPGMLAALVVALEVGVVPALAYGVVLGVGDGLLTYLVWSDATGDAPLALLLLLSAMAGQLLRTTTAAGTAATRAEQELATANGELHRALAREGELVLAEERARSARELHDGLGHRLTLASMSLQFARRTHERDPDLAWAEVGTAAESVRRALGELDTWARAVDHTGAGGLDEVAAAFRGAGLDVRLRQQGLEQPLSRELALFATRFVQEGLTNVLKHASADRVDVAVVTSPQQVRLTIEDDGVGRGDARPGFGLRSLQERAGQLGGEVTSGRSSAGGFELVAVLPRGTEED